MALLKVSNELYRTSREQQMTMAEDLGSGIIFPGVELHTA